MAFLGLAGSRSPETHIPVMGNVAPHFHGAFLEICLAQKRLRLQDHPEGISQKAGKNYPSCTTDEETDTGIQI